MALMECPKCRLPLKAVTLSSAIRLETCAKCSGALYDQHELSVRVDIEDPEPSDLFCPKCGDAKLESGLGPAGLELDRCTRCRALWLDKGEVQTLRDALGVEGILGSHPAGGKAAAAAAALGIAAGPAKRPEPPKAEPKAAPAPAKQAAEPEPEPPDPATYGGYLSPEDGGYKQNIDATHPPRVTHEGRTYQHFQTSWPVTTYVLGEFNWKVRAGEKAQARDFICPPFIVSEDKTEGESAWSAGRYLEPREVWDAFGLQGEPPVRVGVNAAQPNPWEDVFQAMFAPFGVAVAACMAVFLVMKSLSLEQRVLEWRVHYLPGQSERSAVSDVFELKGRTSNVKVDVHGDVHNHWVGVEMALINADTDVAMDFDAEVSYYEGYDEDGKWTEGSRSETVWLPAVPPGNYYLRAEPVSEGGSNIAVDISLTRDVPRFLYLALAVLFLAAPIGFVVWRRRSFEVARWHESDHPMVTEEEDDE